MSEWSNEHAWKACVGVSSPRVRIPPCPPSGRFAAVAASWCDFMVVFALWIRSILRVFAPWVVRLSEIRQDSAKKAVTDAGEFEPPLAATACLPPEGSAACGVGLRGWFLSAHQCHIGARNQGLSGSRGLCLTPMRFKTVIGFVARLIELAGPPSRAISPGRCSAAFFRRPNWPFGQSHGGTKNSSCVDSRITKIEDTKSCPS